MITHIGDATLYLGDCLDVLRTLPDASVDSVVTDPPYGLAFMGKRWDYDVPSVEIWAECLRVLKPGGHLLAFAGTRTQHRMAVRIEDAGFEIRDMLAWLYGSGFPKSLDVSKAIDAQAGAEREVVGNRNPEGSGVAGNAPRDASGSHIWTGDLRSAIPITETAKQWNGWGTALKPALEPITMARKPLAGTVAANVLAYGTGGLNIAASRIQFASEDDKAAAAAAQRLCQDQNANRRAYGDFNNGEASLAPYLANMDAGRWPANVLHDGSDEVRAHFPDAPGQLYAVGPEHGDYGPRENFAPRNDTGSAARFFYCAKASKADRDEGLHGFAKSLPASALARTSQLRGEESTCISATKNPRANVHPTVKPTDLMRYLLRLVTPPGGTALDPFMGSGSTGKAALLEHFKFIGIERDPDYFAIAKARIDYIRRSGVQVGLFGEAA